MKNQMQKRRSKANLRQVDLVLSLRVASALGPSRWTRLQRRLSHRAAKRSQRGALPLQWKLILRGSWPLLCYLRKTKIPSRSMKRMCELLSTTVTLLGQARVPIATRTNMMAWTAIFAKTASMIILILNLSRPYSQATRNRSRWRTCTSTHQSSASKAHRSSATSCQFCLRRAANLKPTKKEQRLYKLAQMNSVMMKNTRNWENLIKSSRWSSKTGTRHQSTTYWCARWKPIEPL